MHDLLKLLPADISASVLDRRISAAANCIQPISAGYIGWLKQVSDDHLCARST
jgi:hypothetical protein